VVLLAGPLLLFNPWFVSALQDRHGVAAAFDAPRSEIDRVTGEVLRDLATGGGFDVSLHGRPLLAGAERSHMSDVSRLVRILAALVVAAAGVAAVTGRRLRHEPHRMARTLVLTAGSLAVAAAVVAAIFVVAFEPAFLAFHAVFFPAGTYLFPPGSNLITLFPEAFWFEASVAAGATVVLSALVTFAVGLAGARAASPPHAPSP
jgi:hypothetical protein